MDENAIAARDRVDQSGLDERFGSIFSAAQREADIGV
jgi:hypothetical protein